ncbi:MAG: hypothetical protein P8Y02_09940 [Deinococcales bacterium]
MDHAASYVDLGGVVDEGRVLHFGAPEAEAAAALDGSGALVVPMPAVTPLRFEGGDRASFLHGQLTAAVQGAPVGSALSALQLNARGQVVGEGALCVRDADVFLAIDDGRGPAVRASLEQHIVFDDVTVEDLSGTLAALTVQGAASEAVVERVLGAVPATGRFVQTAVGGADVLVLRRRRSTAGGFDVHLLARQLPRLLEALRDGGALLAGERAASLARVAAGIASVARDGGAGALPQELGLEAAVASGKGCYLGQEIMARIEARGSVRRHLVRMRLDGAPETLERLADEPERELRVDGREVGRLGSVVRRPDGAWLGLGVVRRDLEPNAMLEVAGARAVLDPAEAQRV